MERTKFVQKEKKMTKNIDKYCTDRKPRVTQRTV